MSAAPGQAGVVVSILADSVGGIAGGSFTLTYDPGILTVREVRSTGLTAGFTVVPNLSAPGQVRVAMAGASGIPSGSGALVVVTFDVRAGVAPGTYDLGIQAALTDEKGRDIPVTTRKGTLTVRGGITPSAPVFSVSTSSLTFDSTRVGVPSQKTLTISNAGTGGLSITRIAVGGADSTQFTVSPAQATVSQGSAQTVTVTFLPISPGPKSASLSIAHNAPGGPHTVFLSGVGIPAGFDTVEVAGPVSLDLNPADGDQGQKVRKGVRAGSAVSIQLFVRNAPPISGYTVRLTLDTTVVRPGSYTSSSFIPNSVTLPPAAPAPDSLDVGTGNLTGETRSGDGLLGTVTFQVTEKFNQETRIAATKVTFSQPGGVRREVQQRVIVTLSAEGKVVTPDFNGDGEVGFDDFFMFAGVFGTRNPDFDLTGDGFVGFDDFFAFAAEFGRKS